jgi:CRP-like cAMP-binding protein
MSRGILRCDIPEGTTLAKENRELERLFFICSGRAKVSIAGREVAQLEAGNFVGEVAFLTERPATATVIAEGAVRALAFERGKLNQFFKHETEVAGLIYQLIGRELAHKIKVSNSLLAAVFCLAFRPHPPNVRVMISAIGSEADANSTTSVVLFVPIVLINVLARGIENIDSRRESVAQH